MDVLDGLDGWSLPDTLQLLSLRKGDRDWFDIASQLKNRFGHQKKETFYNEKTCKERFDRVIGSPHPEHFLRNKGKKYSQKDLLQAWIAFLERKMVEERKKRRQLLMVQFREKLMLFNKLFDDKCDLTRERIHELLEEARREDSKRDQRLIEKGIARVLPKIKELDNLHSSNPDTYGCLRLVVNVPQLCEIEGTELRLSTNSEKGTASVPPNLSLRSGSRSPQKGSNFQNSYRSSASQSLEKTPMQGQPKSTATAPTKQTKNAHLSPQKQNNIQQNEKSPHKSPFASPSHPNAPLSTEGASTSTGVLDITSGSFIENGCTVPQLKVEEDETYLQVKLEPETMELDFVDSSVNSSLERAKTAVVNLGREEVNPLSAEDVGSNSNAEPPVKTVGPVKLESPDESAVLEADFKADKPTGKRQLRSSRKEFGTIDNVNTRLQKNQRGSARRASSSALESSADSSDTSVTTVQQKKRLTSDILGPDNLDSSVAENSKPKDVGMPLGNSCPNEGRCIEEAEELASRRRSERLRGSETPFEQNDVKATLARRKGTNFTEVQEEDVLVAAKKRRKLCPDSNQEIIEAADSLSPKKLVEQQEESDKKNVKNEGCIAILSRKDKKLVGGDVKKPFEAVSRRSSLRSAAQAASEGVRKDALNTDSDEEKTLGDIRDKHRSPRKQVVDNKGTRMREEDSLKKRSTICDEEHSRKLPESTFEAATNNVKKGRGSTKRSGLVTQKAEGPSPKRQTTERKHSKRRDTDDGSTEKKIFLMSAWRLVSSHRHAAIFAHPVSERDAQGYSVTVKRRMDLSTLKRNVESGEVRDLAEFKRRLLLMFANAVMFNSTGHDVNIYAKEMALDTLSSLKDLEKDILYVRGGTHITRRSAAFAAEEERRKILNSNSPLALSKVVSSRDVSEDIGNPMTNVQRVSSSRRSVSKLK